jgi:hypothetical protein
MSDNIQTAAGSGGDPAVATDEIAGAHYQKIKIALGAEDELDTLLDAGQQTMANSVPVAIASNQSPVPVTGTVAVSAVSTSIVPGTAAAHLGKAEDAAHASGDTGVFVLGVRNDSGAVMTSADGDYGAIAVDGSGRQRVLAQGPDDHGAAVGPRPVVIGAEARTSDQAAVSSGSVTRLQADAAGKLVVRSHCVPEQQVSGLASTTGTTDTSVIAAQGTGVRIHVTSISIANSSANDPIIEIKDGSTVIWRTIAPANGGSNIAFDPPLRLSANTALNMASLVASSTVYFSANGYKSA